MNFKTLLAGWLLVAVPALNLVAAEAAKPKSPLEGTWKWTYRTSDGAEVPARVKFKLKDGALTATSSFRPGSDAPAVKLKFQNHQISFDIVREREGAKIVTHYVGELQGDVIIGQITSKLDGVEQTVGWEAKRPSGPEGDWKWSAPGFGPGRTMEWAMSLKLEGGNVTGTMKPGPAGGGRGGGPGRGGPGGGAPGGAPGGTVELHRGSFTDGRLYFETERVSQSEGGGVRTNRFRGSLSGDKIVGQSEVNSGGKYTTNKWEPVRAE